MKKAIGPAVLLYRLIVWDEENEALKEFHRHMEIEGCRDTVYFVSGISVDLITRSHNISDRLLPTILRFLKRSESEAARMSNSTEQAAIFSKLFSTRMKILKRDNFRLKKYEGANGDGIFIRGGTIFRLGEVLEGSKGLFMQFVSAECKVRERRQTSWGIQGTTSSLYVPPLLLVSGTNKRSSEINDVRISLVEKKPRKMSSGPGGKFWGSSIRKTKGWTHHSEVSQFRDIVVFSQPVNEDVVWQKRGAWISQNFGEASTAIISSGRFEQNRVYKHSRADKFHSVVTSHEQIIVVLQGGLLYSRRILSTNYNFSEVFELTPGTAVIFHPEFNHALKPLDPESVFTSFSWEVHGNGISYEKKMDLINQLKAIGFRNVSLYKELLEHGSTKATEGRTISLMSGQAYDPGDSENCDVLVFVIEGNFLQVLPSNAVLNSPDTLLIPAHQSCVLWNIGSRLVKLFVMHLCKFDDAMQFALAFGVNGKVF
ncbi:hypothetical protein KP509_01G038700 [Ceratopteris richardii]|nr:hypothetical protein KP509_01G038700 [Ceratopteris richardii]